MTRVELVIKAQGWAELKRALTWPTPSQPGWAEKVARAELKYISLDSGLLLLHVLCISHDLLNPARIGAAISIESVPYSNGLSTLHFLVLNVLMGWVIVEWMLALAALESLMRAKCLRVLDTTSVQWSWTCNIYECDCGFLWNSPLCACHGQPYDTPRFACQYVRTIILDVSHLLLSAFCVRRACKDASLVLSVPKNLHPLVLSVFFFVFFFKSASVMQHLGLDENQKKVRP